MRRIVSAVTVRFLYTVLWLLRRVDYYVNGSTSLMKPAEFRKNPYTSFEFVRRNGPLLRSYANRGWIMLGFDEVQDALRNPAFSSDFTRNKFIVRLANAATGGKTFPLIDNPPLLNQDPPNHTRLRKLASEGFINRYIQSLAPVIENIVTRLLDRISDRNEFDVVKELAEPLPAIVIAEMMGVPEGDRHRFVDWSHALTGATMLMSPDRMAQAADAEEEMRHYLTDLVTRKQTDREDDFITKLVAAETEDGKLARSEVVSTCILLLTAGHETTTRLIGNGLYTLMQHPDQLSKLMGDRSLMGNAIEEMLRFEPPVQETVRFLAKDIDFRGHKLKAGQMVLVNFAAANRDPRANPEPNRFDITRDSIRHVAFGYGIHLCLGLALARLEARIVFNALFDRYEHLEYLDTEPPWQPNMFFRGLDYLNVRATRRTRQRMAESRA